MMNLVTLLLACPKYERNVLLIEQLADIDQKTFRRQFLHLYDELNQARETVKILRATVGPA
jgi:hypothetical protein